MNRQRSPLWSDIAVVMILKLIFAAVIVFAGWEAHHRWGEEPTGADDNQLALLSASHALMRSLLFAVLYFLSGVFALVALAGRRRFNPVLIECLLFAIWCTVAVVVAS